jgi:hypothetical protein
VPVETPVTTPLDNPTVATAGLLLVHVPPVDALDNVEVNPEQTKKLPVIGVDNAKILTVIGIRLLGQPATT